MFRARALQSRGPIYKMYVTTILRLSYNNAEVTIDLRRSSNLQTILRRTKGFLGTIHLQNRTGVDKGAQGAQASQWPGKIKNSGTIKPVVLNLIFRVRFNDMFTSERRY